MSAAGLDFSGLEQAIAKAEGFFGPSSNVAVQANNPGDLELGDLGFGTTAAAGGQQITNYPSIDAGWTALDQQIGSIFSGGSSKYSPSMTLTQFGQTYTGSQSPAYGNTLASLLGVDPSTTLSQVVNSSIASSPSSPSSSPSSPSSSGSWWSNLFNTAANAALFPGTSPSSDPPLQRIVAVLVGLILIGGGLMMFRQTQVVIEGARGVASKGAEVAGALAG